MEPARDPDAISNGAHAAQLIQKQTRRLGRLQPEVLADSDPEPLHQLRVSLRRLRTVLAQFQPALILPDHVSERRIARVARRTGLCRDLDVLRQRLETGLLPSLPQREAKALRPALKHLGRDRRRAFEGLAEALRSHRYLKLLERLHRWQDRPCYTSLGALPLQPWLGEWGAKAVAGLFLEPGWFSTDPNDPALHGLRKRIKGVRYGLENLEPYLQPSLSHWIGDLRQGQDILGELHDLQVLAEVLGDVLGTTPAQTFPQLSHWIERQQSDAWQHWLALSGRLRLDSSRRSLLALLAAVADQDTKKPAGEAGEEAMNG
ncbi:CHAD domain-containing protein [Synechococcus sp. CS-205]|uniref:CHAD domain-containing protein n=1 Tax=Synechococcus sp. CS-205 TaxID=2847984 RepID=UPI00223B0324|nr:CHAD domain-containing protein [Synechococcus sp. CS-205]MCT0249614.1 CHAD domain-containing protein [Synechococcus sp. CS-205]